MPDPNASRPSDGELKILRVLWRDGPLTVRQVLDKLEDDGALPVVYTTVLKTMQIMARKGLVRRDESERAHVYEAVATEESTKKNLAGDLLSRVFDGSARQLVLQALAWKKVDPEEMREIDELLERLEEKEHRP